VLFTSENRSNAHRENPYSLKAVNSFQAISIIGDARIYFSLAKQRVNFLQKELANRNICTSFGDPNRNIQRVKITQILSQSSIELRAIHLTIIPEWFTPLGQSSFCGTDMRVF
jgi:hypothetical protein